MGSAAKNAGEEMLGKNPVLFLASLLLWVGNAPQFSVPTPKCYLEHNPFWFTASSPPSSNHPQTSRRQLFKQWMLGGWVFCFSSFSFYYFFITCVTFTILCTIYICIYMNLYIWTCLFTHAYWYTRKCEYMDVEGRGQCQASPWIISTGVFVFVLVFPYYLCVCAYLHA